MTNIETSTATTDFSAPRFSLSLSCRRSPPQHDWFWNVCKHCITNEMWSIEFSLNVCIEFSDKINTIWKRGMLCSNMLSIVEKISTLLSTTSTLVTEKISNWHYFMWFAWISELVEFTGSSVLLRKTRICKARYPVWYFLQTKNTYPLSIHNP